MGQIYNKSAAGIFGN